MTTAIDGFAGAGGSTEGLTQAGIDVLVAANHWPTAVATHKLNHPGIEHRIANLSETNWSSFPRTAIAWWSPSCVGHTLATGKKAPTADQERRRDTAAAVDRATAFAAVACADLHRQPVLLIENVLNFRRWALYPGWLGMLHALGYRTRELILNARDFGHAQDRKRLFIVATQPGVEIDLTMPPQSAVPASTILDPDLGERVTRRLYVTPQIEEITEDGVPHLVTYRNHARARRADRYPIATVTAGGNHHAVATLVDGVPHHRMLTDRERARAQGFPDTYRFTSRESRDVIKQIGNAVPVGIARWLGECAAAALGETTTQEVAA
ncbi:DNA cytosine methyltransferase [Pseudonocardia parietis]|uniref:DNA (cytosine-5-)-methyltransferase n=1 Tax=Pseudonocardia parietis TaxID=570936 RepID=A0ABS4W278_9PSEU|nr:DNA cytosine methyltransferase [Pseudonocardia parietis]MBP2370279.1 DNA (cytosine-5)-methyltransferase 1 [Pseudonocardia parietis]